MSEKEFDLVLKFDMIFSVLRELLKFDVYIYILSALLWIHESKSYYLFKFDKAWNEYSYHIKIFKANIKEVNHPFRYIFLVQTGIH